MPTSSENSSQTLVPIFSIEIPGRLPSWNDILGMEQWARYKFKNELADAFLSVLSRIANDSSTKTTLQRSTTSIYAATLESYLRMKQERRKSRQAKLKQSKAKKSESSSKSSKSFQKRPTLKPPCPPPTSTPTPTTDTTGTSLGFNPTKDGDAPW